MYEIICVAGRFLISTKNGTDNLAMSLGCSNVQVIRQNIGTMTAAQYYLRQLECESKML